jgi:HD-like signal output (HDOD) protein
LLDRAGRGQLHWTQRFPASKCPTYSAWEGSIFGVDNCEVAALILDEWRFPKELSSALRTHYLGRAGDSENQLACLLNLANGLAQVEKRDLAGEASWWPTTPEKLRGAGLTVDDLSAAGAAANVSFEAALAALAM